MSTFTVAECDIQIANLKLELAKVTGTARIEKIKEGMSELQIEDAFKSIVEQLRAYENWRNEAISESTSDYQGKSCSYIPSRVYGR